MLCSGNNLLLWSCFSLYNFFCNLTDKMRPCFFDFWNFPPCTGSRQRPIENPLWNPRYSTSGLVNQRKGMTYNPWTTESKQKTPCYFRVYYTCVFMRQQRHEVFMKLFLTLLCNSKCIQYTRSTVVHGGNKASWVLRHTWSMNYSWVEGFWWNWAFLGRRTPIKLIFFCMKEQVLLNTNNMLVIITHFSNENSNTATYHYSVVVHL